MVVCVCWNRLNGSWKADAQALGGLWYLELFQSSAER